MSTEMKEAKARLELCAEWTSTEAPNELLDDNGSPSQELLRYCRKESLNLDWLFIGDIRSLVLAGRRNMSARA